MIKKIILPFLIAILFISNNTAQEATDSELYKTILSKDSLLFQVGFNTCDISQFENLLSADLQFFHDRDGISDRAKFLNDLKNGLCANPEIRQVKRILVKDKTEIFPMYKNGTLYGAVQNGEHLFYEGGENETGIAKFSNVWTLEKGDWKLTTSLSFDHGVYQEPKAAQVFFENDSAIEQWLKENKVPTLGLGVIEAGKLQQIKVFGALENGSAAPYNTVFNVASLTKPVTAMVTLKLVSLGQWNLDEPIDAYWTDPDVAHDANSKILTTRHILSHQSGFTNWRGNNKDGKLYFEFMPGTKYQYSGEGFEYLRSALEEKFKKPLNQLASELIFTPLKMTDTQFVWDEEKYSSRYAFNADKEGNVYETVKRTNPNAADDLLTTIEDYGKFLVSVMNRDGLSENVYKDMIANQVVTKKGKHFGLGFEIYNFKNGEYAISHGGADKGVQTIVFLFPRTKKGLLIFTNVDDGYKVYEPIISQYLGEQGQEIIAIETAE